MFLSIIIDIIICSDPINYKAIGFHSNTGPDPLKNHKATKPAFKVRPSFKWRFAGGPILVAFGSSLTSSTKSWTPPAKLSGSAHGTVGRVNLSLGYLSHMRCLPWPFLIYLLLFIPRYMYVMHG